MKTRVEFIPGSSTLLGGGKVQVSFAYLEDDVVVKRFTKVFDEGKVSKAKDAEEVALSLLPFAEGKWGANAPKKTRNTEAVEAAFDRVAAVRTAEAAPVAVVKEAPVSVPVKPEKEKPPTDGGPDDDSEKDAEPVPDPGPSGGTAPFVETEGLEEPAQASSNKTK